MDKLKQLAKRALERETVRYLIFGGLTTAVSFISFYTAERLLHIPYETANVISWVLAVSFAYVTNKLFVFNSADVRGLAMLWELLKFFAARVATLLIGQMLLILLVDRGGVDSMVGKAIITVTEVVLNYVFSKLAVFVKSKKHTDADQ